MKFKERLLFGVPTMLWVMGMITADAANLINIDKFGYAAFGTWLGLLINFYYRKSEPN